MTKKTKLKLDNLSVFGKPLFYIYDIVPLEGKLLEPAADLEAIWDGVFLEIKSLEMADVLFFSPDSKQYKAKVQIMHAIKEEPLNKNGKLRITIEDFETVPTEEQLKAKLDFYKNKSQDYLKTVALRGTNAWEVTPDNFTKEEKEKHRSLRDLLMILNEKELSGFSILREKEVTIPAGTNMQVMEFIFKMGKAKKPWIHINKLLKGVN